MKVGYVRVSTAEQNTARQDVLMANLGVEKIFTDKASGRSRNARPELERMLDFIREGDEVIVESVGRFARSAKDFLNLITEIEDKGVRFVSKKESFDSGTPQGRFALTMFAALAQLEVDTIAERRNEGIAIAKAEGRYTGRKPIDIDEEVLRDIHSQWYKGEITTAFAIKKLGVSRNTFYRRMWDYEEENGIPRKGK